MTAADFMSAFSIVAANRTALFVFATHCRRYCHKSCAAPYLTASARLAYPPALFHLAMNGGSNRDHFDLLEECIDSGFRPAFMVYGDQLVRFGRIEDALRHFCTVMSPLDSTQRTRGSRSCYANKELCRSLRVEFSRKVQEIMSKGRATTEERIFKFFMTEADDGRFGFKALAQFFLAVCFTCGTGVQRCTKTALYWLNESAGAGFEEAHLALEHGIRTTVLLDIFTRASIAR